ncbi:MAG: phosphorylase [Phormidesmis sp. RL_2_1]|nr:phosphorylase [Phormidesmis sp. RL_2_1]
MQWQSGSLWSRLKTQSAHGLRIGALQPIETALEQIDSGGMRFIVRVLAHLSQKEKARRQQARAQQVGMNPTNPFLPYENDLYVCDISPTHLCLLNKFNVVDHHFLIVTRQFEPQENWLTLADFEALTKCLAETDGLAFFNGGKVAGASQPHKHLQVIPYLDGLTAFPIDQLIMLAPAQADGVMRSPLLAFRHAMLPIEMDAKATTLTWQPSAQQLLISYRRLLRAVKISETPDWKGIQTMAYNFLCTRQWMMVVPRSQEKYAGISVNALGFAGSLLVKNQAGLKQLQAIGPMNLLQQVGCSAQ